MRGVPAATFRAVRPASRGGRARYSRIAIWLIVLGSVFAFGKIQGQQRTDDPRPGAPLLTVKQVHDLSPQDAGQHRPVRLRGVVTAFSGWRDYFFFQDATGGLAVNREEHQLVHVGDEVELSGVSDPGLFSNSVISRQVRVIGPGEMPVVGVSTYSDLEGGIRDAEWVEVEGVVQSARVETIWEKRVLVLGLEIGGNEMSVRVFHFSAADAARFVDARVRVGGVCGTAYNDKRQFTGLRLFVAEAGAIKVEEEAAADPYADAPHPVRTVMQIGPRDRARHRIKVAGVVTYQENGRFLYIQDGTDGILVWTSQDEPVELGTRVEALGFPALGTYSPVLTNGSFRVDRGAVRSGATVGQAAPLSIRAADFLQYKDTFAYAPYDGELVNLRATVVSPLALPNEDAWLMRDGENEFVATLRRGANRSATLKLDIGTKVSVTGVMEVTVDADHQPQAFRVLLRGREDLAVIERAPWWTPGYLLVVLGVLLAATLAVILWTMLLRRQVKRQTKMLQESEGRFRSQAEHDALTGVSSRSFFHEQLDLAIKEARKTGGMFGVLMLDLDHFKQVNDTMGHDAGDELLRIVANRIRSTVRREDVVARMGGDEFVVLLMDVGHESLAEQIGAELVANVAVPAQIGAVTMAVSASVGVCTYPAGGTDGRALLRHVDEAMYKAKARGRNSFCLYKAA